MLARVDGLDADIAELDAVIEEMIAPFAEAAREPGPPDWLSSGDDSLPEGEHRAGQEACDGAFREGPGARVALAFLRPGLEPR